MMNARSVKELALCKGMPMLLWNFFLGIFLKITLRFIRREKRVNILVHKIFTVFSIEPPVWKLWGRGEGAVIDSPSFDKWHTPILCHSTAILHLLFLICSKIPSVRLHCGGVWHTPTECYKCYFQT